MALFKNKKILIAFCIGIFIFIVDVLSKYYVCHSIPQIPFYSSFPFGGIAVFKNFCGIDFSIVHAANKGTVWGLFASYQQYLIWIRWIIVGILLAYVYLSKNARSQLIAYSLIISGALGNIIDFYLYGHVIDMFYFIFFGYSYPVFNIADSAIFCGTFWLLMQAFIIKQPYVSSIKN